MQQAHRRYRCRFCGRVLPAWLPHFAKPDGALLLHHLSQQHRDRVRPYLDRMGAGEDIATVAAEGYAVVEGDNSPPSTS